MGWGLNTGLGRCIDPDGLDVLTSPPLPLHPKPFRPSRLRFRIPLPHHPPEH